MKDVRIGDRSGRLALALTLCFSSLAVAAPPDRQSGGSVLAEVGDQVITRDELVSFVADGLYPYLFPVRSEAYQHALYDLVTEELKRIDLFASGHADDSALVHRLARNITEELGLAYTKRRYEDRYLNEEKIRAEHVKMGRIVSYHQIVIAKPSNRSEAELETLRSVIEEIQRQLTEGSPIETVAAQYPDLIRHDPSEASQQVTWDQTLTNPRAFVLFGLEPGDVRSFEGPLTFSVVRIDKVERTPSPPLESVREQIVSALHRWYSHVATEAFRAEWGGLVDTLNLQWHPGGLEQLTSWLRTPDFFERDYRRVIEDFLSANGDAPVLSDGRGTVRLSDVPRIVESVLMPTASGKVNEEVVQDYLLEAVRTERLAERARAEGLMDEIWRADTSSPLLARQFVEYYNEKFIEERIPEATEDRLRAFYQTFADSLFYQLERVRAEIIVRSNENEIQEIWERSEAGVPFDSLSHRRLIRSFERTRAGEIVTRFDREPPYLGSVAFALDEGEISRPVSYEDAREGKLYAIVRVTQRLEERQLSFEEVRARIEKDFEDFHRARLAAQVEEDLRKRYPVQIYADAVDALVSDSSISE